MAYSVRPSRDSPNQLYCAPAFMLYVLRLVGSALSHLTADPRRHFEVER